MIGNDWDQILVKEYEKDYFKELKNKVKEAYSKNEIFPKYEDIFNAFKYTPYQKVKIVILGQDPYHNPNQAHGLSFSVPKGERKPPSLKNIFKELSNDLGIMEPDHGNLEGWAKEGILLLNSILTVERGKPSSHKNIGWEKFTDEVIRILDNKKTPVIFILWGNFAKSKKKLIVNNQKFIIEGSHPSPFSAHRGFLGTKPFSKVNNIIKNGAMEGINWQIK
ncbi:MAG: uracil-DNA glycosylase [Bacilli bacterium]|nr:uracil-DNA glycosylase [Bacilli bacterium]